MTGQVNGSRRDRLLPEERVDFGAVPMRVGERITWARCDQQAALAQHGFVVRLPFLVKEVAKASLATAADLRASYLPVSPRGKR